MGKQKKYSKADDLFILNSLVKYPTLECGFKNISTVLNRTPQAIMFRYYNLKKRFPHHEVYKIDWRHGNTRLTKKEKWYRKIFKLFTK